MKFRPFPHILLSLLVALLALALSGCTFPTRTPAVTPGSPNPTIPPLPGGAGTSVPQTVDIYLIALGDGGQTGPEIGCGDSVVAVPVQIPATQGVLRSAMQQMLSIDQEYYGQSGLYNALYQSDLSVDSISIDNGAASIYLTGDLVLGGVCDSPRVEAQLTQTATQFSTVQSAQIYVNGTRLQDLLSQQ